jgi:putative peptidoglycan lipid II flippase
MIRLFNRESKSIVGAATIVGALSFTSRIVGLIRDRILAGSFGAGDQLDVYYAAFKIPDFLFSLIVIGALSASFVPLFVKRYSNVVSKKGAWRFTNNMIHVLGGLMILISIGIALFAHPLSSLIAPGFSDIKQADVAIFMRVMVIGQVFLAISMIFGSVLQSLRRFFLYALAPIFYNIGIIFGALVLVQWMGLIGLAWGVVLGAGLHFLVQFLGVKNVGYRYQYQFSLKDSDTKELLRLTGPRLLGIATTQILFLILSILATTLGSGSVTIFQFAYNIQFFAVGIVGVSFAVAVFPILSDHIERKKTKQFIDTLASTIRQTVFLLVPLMMLFLIFRAQIVRVVVGAGEFDWNATIATADTLAFFALTFIPQALVFILARGFYALHDTITPLMAGFVGALFGVMGAFLFSGEFNVIGLGMAYSLASFVNALLLWIPLRQRLGSLGEASMVPDFFKIFAAGIVCALVMQLFKPVAIAIISLDTFVGVFSQGLFAGGLGLVAYVVVSKWLRVSELDVIITAVKRKVLKKSKPEETLSPTTLN